MYHHKYTITGTSTHVNFLGTQSKTCCNQNFSCSMSSSSFCLCASWSFSASASASCQDEHLCTGTQQYIQFYTCIGLPNITSTQNKNTNAVLLFFLEGTWQRLFEVWLAALVVLWHLTASQPPWLVWWRPLELEVKVEDMPLEGSLEQLKKELVWPPPWEVEVFGGAGPPVVCQSPLKLPSFQARRASRGFILPRFFLVSLHQTPHKYKTCCNLRYKHRQYNTSKVQNTQKYKVLPRHEMGLHSSSM